MSVTINISEKTYKSLEQQARRRELESVEQFLEKLTEQFESEETEAWNKELERRGGQVERIRKFRQKMKKKYGVMPDSTEIIREDRMRG